MLYNSYGPNTLLKCIYIPLGIMSLKASAILFYCYAPAVQAVGEEKPYRRSKNEKCQKSSTVNTLRRFAD